MKKTMICTALLLLSANSVCGADIPVDIRVNGDYIITDCEPVIYSGTTYAPIRAVADALGAEDVVWDNGTAYVYTDGKSISVSIGSDTAYSNSYPVKMTGKAFIHNDRTFIPVRSMSELFEATVSWDDEYKNVELHKNSSEVPEYMIDRSFTHDELYWMSRIISAESRGESLAGKIAVGDVILNRVKSPEFPNSVYGVIFDKKYGVQFEPTINGSIYSSPTAESVAAAKLSFTNKSTVGNSLYFFNPKIASSSWISQNRQYYTTIGGHDFYL